MRITRNNYEEFFLLYVDNELSAADRQTVERFVAENPDLTEEWDLLLQCRIHPDQHLVFTDRESLFMKEGGLTADNYEEFFLSYVDGELEEDTRKSVEELVRRHPSLRTELASLQRTVSVPDPAIVFENKEVLYKKERERRPLFLPWQVAAAALVAGVIGLFFFNPFKKGPGDSVIPSYSINKKTEQTKPATSPTATFAPASPDTTSLTRTNLPAAVKKNERTVTPRPSSALHLSEAGQPDGTTAMTGKGEQDHSHTAPAKEKEADPGNSALAQTDPPANTRVIDQTPVRIATAGIDGPDKTLVLTTPVVNHPKTTNEANTSFATQALLNAETGSPEDGLAMESSPAKKNKLRGLFRKVTRVLEKSTSRDEDDKHNILIGSFQFALK